MGILKYISLFSFFIFLGCKNITYTSINDSFYGIYLKDWNSSLCPKKAVYQRYVKGSNFKEMIISNSDFDIGDCEDIYKSTNQRIFTPKKSYNGIIDYDIRFIINDSLEYKITSIDNNIDTIFSGGRPGDFIIMNNIKSFIVNGHKVDNSETPLNIFIPTKFGKVLNKKMP
ncbi:hypothetical protein [Flavobacterium hungaricum]|uniref:Lipoprotein n=1 Tax=Flavobacterium hungaricum TaxID=2082725 RepID=A0ABR9TG33_9FLAO|nr:hypothetical protein [Flavobacterium hungaricum]MBE8724251.1 hypothetical protein [Flavobacterium hungaricum]